MEQGLNRRRFIGHEALAEFVGDAMGGGGMVRQDVNHLLALLDPAAGRKANAEDRLRATVVKHRAKDEGRPLTTVAFARDRHLSSG